MVQFCFPLYIRRFNTLSHVTYKSLEFVYFIWGKQAHYKTILRLFSFPSDMQLHELGSVLLMNMNNHLLNKRKMKVSVCKNICMNIAGAVLFYAVLQMPPCFLIPYAGDERALC